MSIEKTYTERGFAKYGDPLTCSYGKSIRVYESSSAEGSFCWLSLKGDTGLEDEKPEAEAYGNEWILRDKTIAAHMDVDTVKNLIAQLSEWVEDHEDDEPVMVVDEDGNEIPIADFMNSLSFGSA